LYTTWPPSGSTILDALVRQRELATRLEVLNLTDGDPEELLHRVRAAEVADSHGERWGRFKTGDPAATAYLSIDG